MPTRRKASSTVEGIIPTCTKANPFRTSPSDRHVRLGQCMLLSAGWYQSRFFPLAQPPISSRAFPVAESRPSPRCTVLYEDSASTWSAFYGAIPLGQGFATVSDAWDAIDRMAASRAALAPAAARSHGADADEPAEASGDDGGDPDHRQGRQH